ncbi:MAG TPA: GNAT family N-acetyltransferase [Ruminiclostridium sp.]
MIDNTIRRMKDQEFKEIFNRIERDFAPGEYAPYDVILQQLQKGVQEGLILCEGEHDDVAYSICTDGNTNGYVLISLLAVYEEFRGHGIGSVFLKELSRIYSGKQGIIVEVEKPENSLTQGERFTRIKRIEFYEKAGFYLIPNIDYSIWDVPMHIMVLLHSASMQPTNERVGQIMYEIYLELMGERYIHKMKFRTVNK